jgi:eukaryotic-like serine/threonine-protein kinase
VRGTVPNVTAALAETGSLVGQTVGGKFSVEAHIGSGAMGDVYRATHVGLGRTVALKVMRSDLSDETFVARFQREARAASALDHPNTVRVLDFGTESSGLAYIAMEFLNGRDLYDLIKKEYPLPSERIVDLLGQALSAMKAAHRLGIVHRDIKPENIMVTLVPDEEGELREIVKVCDFGIAKLIDTRGSQTEPGRALTGTGTLVGTPEYMSPEQSRGEPLDARSDLYSMGIVLFQMLTARVPFSSETPIGIVVKQVTDMPPRPSSLRPDVDPRLEDICLRALEKRPEDRFQSAGEMRAALRGVADPSAPLTSTRMAVASQPSLSNIVVAAVSTSSVNQLRAVGVADFGSRPTLVQGEPVFVPEPQPHEAPSSEKKKPRRSALAILLLVLLASTLLGGLVAVVTRIAGTKAEPIASATPGPLPGTSLGSAEPTPSVVPESSAKPASTAHHGPLASSGKKLPPPLPPASAQKPSPSATAMAPSATAEPPAAPLNTDNAFVRIGHVGTSVGAQSSVTAFMGRAAPTLSNCYRAALKATQLSRGGTLSIALSLDDKGRVISVVVVPSPLSASLPDLPRCFQGALANQTVGPVDATTTADIQLALVPPH